MADYFKIYMSWILDTLAVPANDPLKITNPINIFKNKSKHYFVLFLISDIQIYQLHRNWLKYHADFLKKI